MTKQKKRAIDERGYVVHLFCRDLRLQDNTGLAHAVENGHAVLPLFVVNPKQASTSNPYRSIRAIQFMLESVRELADEIRRLGGEMHVRYGEVGTILEQYAKDPDCVGISVHEEVTPFGRSRNQSIVTLFQQHRKSAMITRDVTLHTPGTILTGKGEAYKVFTPFYRNATTKRPEQCRAYKTEEITWYPGRAPQETLEEIESRVIEDKQAAAQGGRKEALRLLDLFTAGVQYDALRDIPSEQGTTMLSPHIKFGTLSIREVFHALSAAYGQDSGVVRQLYWREFYYHLSIAFPYVYGSAFREQFNTIRWRNDPEGLKKWKQGRTGIPIIDAGMRQLNLTGTMHNRVRMLTASYLVKDLGIDWREGEQYFATQLTDYDPAVNNGNWQWVASTGADAQPYFRVFNPWRQQKKFDPEAKYIYTWIPELRDYPPSVVHGLERQAGVRGVYPGEMIDHTIASGIVRDWYKTANMKAT